MLNYHAMKKTYWDVGTTPCILRLGSNGGEVSGQLETPVTLPSGKGSEVPIGQEDVWGPEPASKKFLP